MSDSNFYKYAGLFIISLGIYFLLMVVLERIGISQSLINNVTAAYLVLLFAIPTFYGGAIRSARFFFSERRVTSGISALATACVAALPFTVAFSGYYFFNATALIALFSTSACIALALFTLLFARPFRQSGATSLANFQINRFKSTAVARLASIVHLTAGVFLLIACLKIASSLGVWFFNTSDIKMSLMLCAAIAFIAAFGGVASTARQAAVAMVCLLIAINIPLALESFSVSGFPAGFVSFVTSAMVPSFEIENQLRQEDYKLLNYAMTSSSSTSAWTNLNWNIAAILTALGTLSTPSLMQQFTMPFSNERASNSGQKTILVLGGLFLSMFALMAFLKLSMYETLLGLQTIEVRLEAPFLYDNAISNANNLVDGLVAVCGEQSSTHSDLISACGGSPSNVITLADIQFNGDFLLAASGMLMGYPYALSAFLVVAIILSILAFCSSTILSISTNLISAFFSSSERHLASAEMFLARFTVILIAMVIFILGQNFSFDTIKLIIFAFGIYVASLLPSLVASFYWKRANNLGMVLSISVGFILTLGICVLGYFGIDLDPDTPDQVVFIAFGNTQIDPVLNSMFVLPISVLVLVAFSFVGKPKNDLQEATGEIDFTDEVFDDSDDKVTIAKNRF